jgi:methionyl aminopeptidase
MVEYKTPGEIVLAEAHATSPFLGYQPMPAQSPFPAVICASVNDAALHDIPADTRLIDIAGQALRAGISAAVPGARLGDISAAIGKAGRDAHYGIPADFGGHGIGHAMHQPCAAPTAAGPLTSSTPSPSLTTGRSS